MGIALKQTLNPPDYMYMQAWTQVLSINNPPSISDPFLSSIFRLCGIPAQKTMLGCFSEKGKTKIVSACRDFSENHKRFFDFCPVKNSLTESESSGASDELNDITEAINIQPYLPPAVITGRF